MAQRTLDRHETEALLRNQRVVRVAFSAEGKLYLLPLGYIWFDQALHLVTTPGQKSRMAASNDRVAFQLDDSADQGLLGWSSVTGEGHWEVVGDRSVQEKTFAALLDRFPELRQWADDQYNQKESAGELLFARIKPIWMTGRAFSYEAAPMA